MTRGRSRSFLYLSIRVARPSQNLQPLRASNWLRVTFDSENEVEMLDLHYGLDNLWEALDKVLDDAAHLGLVDERLVLVLELLVELIVVLAGLLGL